MSAEKAPSQVPAPPVLYSFKDNDLLSDALADFVIQAQDDAVSKRGKFTLAISGGSLPKVLAKSLATRSEAKWDAWEVFFADERLVPLDHPESNYLENKKELFSKVSIPEENIHTINVEYLDDPEECADDYEQQMVSTFAGKNAVAFPRFDLILLGVGPDGHTCSLFPDHVLLSEDLRWVAWLDNSPKPPPTRITLTFPALNHAHRVAFVTTGEGKKDILPQVLDKPGNLPPSRVKPSPPGQTYYFCDDAATVNTQYQRSEFKL